MSQMLVKEGMSPSLILMQLMQYSFCDAGSLETATWCQEHATTSHNTFCYLLLQPVVNQPQPDLIPSP